MFRVLQSRLKSGEGAGKIFHLKSGTTDLGDHIDFAYFE
jgi:hypothetical protein